jgi:hypothetical protein
MHPSALIDSNTGIDGLLSGNFNGFAREWNECLERRQKNVGVDFCGKWKGG